MFDKFFEEHAPESAELPSAESVDRINTLLKSRVSETTVKEEKPMKVKKIKGVLLVAAAAVITAMSLVFSATAGDESDDKYIVRINNKRVDADIVSYKEGRIELDVVTYELPCEMLIDKNGKPVTEDSDIDRREVNYILHVYASDDPEEQVWDPEKGVKMLSSGSGWFSMYDGDAMRIPVPNGAGGTNLLDLPAVLECHYDEKQAKQFWENYWKNPDEESQKWAEICTDFTKNAEDLSMAEALKKHIGEHFVHTNEYITESEKTKIIEFLDQNFGEGAAK